MVTLADFVVRAAPPADARAAALRAVLDTVGVILAGQSEPAALRRRQSLRSPKAPATPGS